MCSLPSLFYFLTFISRLIRLLILAKLLLAMSLIALSVDSKLASALTSSFFILFSWNIQKDLWNSLINIIASLCTSLPILFISRDLWFSIFHFLLLFSSNLLPFFYNLVFCSFFSVFCWKVPLEKYYDKKISFVLNFYLFLNLSPKHDKFLNLSHALLQIWDGRIFYPLSPKPTNFWTLSCFFYIFGMGEFFIPSHQNWQIFEPSNAPFTHLGWVNFLSPLTKTDKFFIPTHASFTDFRLEFQLINLLTLP